MSETGERGRASPAVVIRARFVLEAIGWIVLALVALIALDRSRHVLALVLVAITLAVLLHAPITALARRLPRWAAIVTVIVGSVIVLAGILAMGTIELRTQIDKVDAAVTERIDAVDPDSSLGEFLADANVAERISERLDELPSQILVGTPSATDGAGLAVEALLVIVLVVYALLNGTRLLRPLTLPGAPWWSAAVREGVESGAAQVRRLLGIALASGVVGWLIALLFGLPGAGVLGIWAGVWSVVPIFGPIVGYAPMVVVASLDGTGRAAAVGAVAALLAVGGWYLDRYALTPGRAPAVHRLGSFGLTIALVVGLQFGWLTGPLVAIAVMASAVSALAVSTEESVHRPPRPATSTTGGTVWSHLAVRSSARATSVVVAAVAAIAVVISLSPVPVWAIVGVTLALALDPLVSWIDERITLGRGAAIAVVIVGLLGTVAVTLVVAVPSVASSVRDLDDQLPEIAADLEELPVIGGALADRGFADRLQSSVEELPDRIATDSGPIEGTLRSVGDGLLATFWILLITITALVDLARVRNGLRSLVARDRRTTFDRVDSITRDVVARYAVGSVVIALIAGSAVFVIALVAGIPLAPLLGLWAFIANFIPQIGGYLGGAPLAVMALTLGANKGVIVAVVYLIYMQLENRIIQPVIVSKAVDIAPFVAMVGVLIGGAAAGVVGAVLVTPLIAVATTIRAELLADTPGGGDRPD